MCGGGTSSLDSRAKISDWSTTQPVHADRNGGCMFGLPYIPVVAGMSILAVLFIMTVLAKLFRKAGPHEALIIYGLRGTRIVKGGGTIIYPMIEQCRELSLELM